MHLNLYLQTRSLKTAMNGEKYSFTDDDTEDDYYDLDWQATQMLSNRSRRQIEEEESQAKRGRRQDKADMPTHSNRQKVKKDRPTWK